MSNSAKSQSSSQLFQLSACPLKVLFIGATGNIGFNLLKLGLLSPKYSQQFKVTVGSRAANLENAGNQNDQKKAQIEQLKALGASFIELDLDHCVHSSLVALIKNFDILVCLTSYSTSLQTSLSLLSAAKEAGNLKLFVPSEFGGLYEEMDIPATLPSLNEKLQLAEALSISGVPYARIHTGTYYEYFFGPFGGFDLEKRTVTAPGSFQSVSTIMSEKDASELTAEILMNYDQPYVRNQRVMLGGQVISWGDAVALLEEKTGTEWQKKEKTIEEMEKTIAQASVPPFVKMFESWHLLMARQKGFTWNPNHENYFIQKHTKTNTQWKYKLTTVKEYVQQQLKL